MGINLEAFRSIVGQSVLGNHAINVTGNLKDGLSVSPSKAGKGLKNLDGLAKASPEALTRYQDNIYLRSQLLSAIRDALGGDTSEFFKQAETRLFGKIGKDHRFGVSTASSDLMVDELKQIITDLDKAMSSGKAKQVQPGIGKSQGTSGNAVLRNKFSQLATEFVNLQKQGALYAGEGNAPIGEEEMRRLAINFKDRSSTAVTKLEEDTVYFASMFGESLLLAEHLDEFEMMAVDAKVSANDLLSLVTKRTKALCHPENAAVPKGTDLHDDGAMEAARKKYIIDCIRNYLGSLTNAFDTIRKMPSAEQPEALEKLFRANVGACLELRQENLSVALLGECKNNTDPIYVKLSDTFNGAMSELGGAEEIKNFFISVNHEFDSQASNDDLIESFFAFGKEIEASSDTTSAKQVRQQWECACNQLRASFKTKLIEMFVGLKRPAFELEKQGETWQITNLIDDKGKPILKIFTEYDLMRMADRYFDFQVDDPLINGCFESKNVTVNDERGPGAQNEYFVQMKSLAAMLSENEFASADFQQFADDVGSELLRDNFQLERHSLIAHVKGELRFLSEKKDEKGYQSKYGDFFTAAFNECLTNRDRLVKLMADRIFLAENPAVYDSTINKWVPSRSNIVRNIMPDALRIARVIKRRFSESDGANQVIGQLRASNLNTYQIACKIANGFLALYDTIDNSPSIKSDIKLGMKKFLSTYVTESGHIKFAPKDINAIRTNDENNIWKFLKTISKLGIFTRAPYEVFIRK